MEVTWEIRKVWKRIDGVKFISIPRDSKIQEGDYVKIIKLTNENGKTE